MPTGSQSWLTDVVGFTITRRYSFQQIRISEYYGAVRWIRPRNGRISEKCPLPRKRVGIDIPTQTGWNDTKLIANAMQADDNVQVLIID